MRLSRVLAGTALLSCTLPVLAAGHGRRVVSHLHLMHNRVARTVSHSTGQRTIDDSRASEIQTALAGAGYLSGQPSGHWDPQTESAMQRYQADHGWQTRLMPDSRAIIKLGLGPKPAASASSFDGLGSTASVAAGETFPPTR